jgi:hypothetical protein
VLVLWKGLFDEEMVLGRVRLGEAGIWREITTLTRNRASYEAKIKERAFEGCGSRGALDE